MWTEWRLDRSLETYFHHTKHSDRNTLQYNYPRVSGKNDQRGGNDKDGHRKGGEVESNSLRRRRTVASHSFFSNSVSDDCRKWPVHDLFIQTFSWNIKRLKHETWIWSLYWFVLLTFILILCSFCDIYIWCTVLSSLFAFHAFLLFVAGIFSESEALLLTN